MSPPQRPSQRQRRLSGEYRRKMQIQRVRNGSRPYFIRQAPESDPAATGDEKRTSGLFDSVE